MAPSKASLLPTAVIALVFGLGSPDPNLTGESFPFPNDWTLLAADETRGTEQSQVQSEENADESAKMGEDSGTHTGDEADTPESDTKKVDQPPRRDPTSSN
jgi:hypothetical protein